MKTLKKLVLFSTLICNCLIVLSQESAVDIKYKRSSLHTLMISDLEQEYIDTIQNIFINAPLIDKFNNHIVKNRLIPKTDSTFVYIPASEEEDKPKKKSGFLSKIKIKSEKKQDEEAHKHLAILNYLNTNGIAKEMVAKWFNRSETGGFNMDLIAERGYYNASDLDVKIANSSERGSALLADAGEALIKNTFVIVNDFKYTNKEEVATKAKGLLSAIGDVAALAGKDDIANAATLTSAGVEVAGKGYVIKTKAHLYKLAWTDEVAAIFYNDFWTDDAALDQSKVDAFNNTNIFKFEYVGTETSWADIQSTSFTKKSNADLISVATVRAVDNVIAKLQREFEVFRTKTPLLSSDPLSAKIGLKEGLEKGDKYEVLEQVLNENGVVEYKRLGVIKVEKDLIWDNRFNANEENTSELEYTTFSGSKNKYYAGMLIRQIN
ncbi:hypothetical protein [Algibacter sp. PT7-4]|uniref:hypothetical protein n=1 Tax=Algibacter ulvanivorans TaxID=3400999 RepID=UPI003AAB4667